jgi:outer membrane immunogenic protein
MRLVMVGVLGVGLGVSPVLAQDYNWSGLYLGAHAGYATGDATADLSHTTGAIIYSDPFPAGAGALDVSEGWLGGLQIGANHQRGGLVFGIETDASWTDLDASGTFTTVKTGPCAPNSCTKWDIDTSVEAMGTIRGRLGILITPRTLIYGTGGLAWAFTDTDQVSHHNGPTFPDAGGVVSGDSRHIGWTAGGGIELKVGGGWSIKGEYLYIDLGEADYHLQGTVNPKSKTPWAESFTEDLQLHTARVGLNYQLWQPEPVIGPLK